MRLFIYLILLAVYIQPSLAQESTKTIDMTPDNWDIPKDATFESLDNRKTLVLKRGRATVKNLQFENGTIEVDVYANSKRSFAGVGFRKQGTNMEEVYMRMHKSNQVD
ncbi:MAG: DUF1080 domain-containing protein, partial [Bacteroidota bacterium]